MALREGRGLDGALDFRLEQLTPYVKLLLHGLPSGVSLRCPVRLLHRKMSTGFLVTPPAGFLSLPFIAFHFVDRSALSP